MTRKKDNQQERSVLKNRELTNRMLWSIADTTWRMFTPPTILVSAGIFADLKLHTIPWITLVSLPVSLGLSVLLVKKQLENSI